MPVTAASHSRPSLRRFECAPRPAAYFPPQTSIIQLNGILVPLKETQKNPARRYFHPHLTEQYIFAEKTSTITPCTVRSGFSPQHFATTKRKTVSIPPGKGRSLLMTRIAGNLCRPYNTINRAINNAAIRALSERISSPSDVRAARENAARMHRPNQGLRTGSGVNQSGARVCNSTRGDSTEELINPPSPFGMASCIVATRIFRKRATCLHQRELVHLIWEEMH